MPPRCSAAVLAGGQGTRMGGPKPRLGLGGEPLIARILRPLAMLFEDVFVVSGDASLAEFGHPVWPDLLAGGPLAGVVTALDHAQAPHCLLLACDMPFLSPPLLRYMTELIGEADVIAPRDERGWHPLHAIYARRIAPAAVLRLEADQGGIQAMYGALTCRAIEPAELARFSRPGRDPLANLNTPEDLEAARAELGG